MGPTISRYVLIVALAVIAAGASAVTPSTAHGQSTGVVIQNFAFMPPTMTVATGTTISWTNMDSVAHTSTSDTGAWDSGTINPGASFQHTFTTAGTFSYHCMIHPSMHGTIVVQGAGTQPPPAATAETLTVTPSTVVVGSRATVQGSGFTPGSRTFVFWRRPDGTSRGVWVITGATGMFSLVLGFAPRHGIGTELVAAVDAAARVTTPFVSVAVLPRGIGPGALTASVNPVPIGGMTVIMGRGFTPGRVVLVQWRRPDSSMAAVRVLTNGAGAFAFQLLADPRHGCGPRTFTALDLTTLLASGPGPFSLGEVC